MDARAAAELAHRLAKLRRDERVDHDRRTPARLLHGDVQVVDVLDARMPDLLERLIRKLRLEREHEPLRRLARRVRDDVELDRHALVAHPREASARDVVCSRAPSNRRRSDGIRRAEGSGRASCGATGRTSASRTRFATSTTLVIERRRSEAGRATCSTRRRVRAQSRSSPRSAAPTSSDRISRRFSSTPHASEQPRRVSTVAVRGRRRRGRCRTTTRASTSCTSTCGVMFAPDHEAVARELARVTKPGGRLALACWTPDGGHGQTCSG